MKCVIINCENESTHGNFVGRHCVPCYNYLKTGKGVNSQAYRNKLLADAMLLQNKKEKDRLFSLPCSEVIVQLYENHKLSKARKKKILEGLQEMLEMMIDNL